MFTVINIFNQLVQLHYKKEVWGVMNNFQKKKKNNSGHGQEEIILGAKRKREY